jgi:hypothetical protein
LRKIFDLDYDDNNLYKIGLLNRKEFEEFVRNLKIFPGHFVKIENFYNYLKNNNFKIKINNNNNYNLMLRMLIIIKIILGIIIQDRLQLIILLKIKIIIVIM